MIKIGDLARICNISTQTLRYYDAEGLLKPDIINPSSGYRFYSVDAVERYKQILFYKNLGFSLEEIKIIGAATEDELREILQKKKIALSEEFERLQKQIKTIYELGGGQKYPAFSEALLLPFENDVQVIGKWELCGQLTDENDPSSLTEATAKPLDREIIFMPGGAFAWRYFWTRGTLYRISPRYTFAIPNEYKTLEREGVRYMTVRFMGDNCIERGEDAVVLLYRQVDCVAYTEHTIRPRIDKTDLPFIGDEAVCGEWAVIDFVPAVADFEPATRHTERPNVYMLAIHFLPRGVCMRRTRSSAGEATHMLRYTKGFVLNDKDMTAEEYTIRTVDGKDFLFVQHKSGDYCYGGMAPHWYVFERQTTPPEPSS